ncbi:unnamed protein product [Polarella glacialis]|uniref:RING-type E3 ubiquitin transferase n=1 Tax=Polarella glacialis TaxID=89957 RepID=A0A813LSN9_POLGL|nr:unnamed protein product [Polarella glacialis]
MGLDDARIFDPHAISETLRCSVCHEVFVDPVYCSGRPCQHVFCSACLEEWLEHQTGCPNCRKPIRRQDLRRHEVIRSFLDELTIKCTAAGCGWHGRQDAFPGHIEICPVRSLELSRDEALEHIKQRDVEITKMRASAELQAEEVAEKNGIIESKQMTIKLNILEISALREAAKDYDKLLASLQAKLAQERQERSEKDRELARLRSELMAAHYCAKADAAQKFADLQAEEAKKALERAALAQDAARAALHEKSAALLQQQGGQKCQAFGQPADQTTNMHIFLTSVSGRTLTLNIRAADTVEVMKLMIQDLMLIPISSFYLTFQSKVLKDGRRIDEYQITKDSTVRMRLRLLSMTAEERKAQHQAAEEIQAQQKAVFEKVEPFWMEEALRRAAFDKGRKRRLVMVIV